MGIYPVDDLPQRLRLHRFFMAGLCYVLWIGLSVTMYYLDSLRIPTNMIIPTLTGVVLTNLYFYAIIRSGLNKRLRDPSMTFSQILVAMAWILVMMFCAAESRGALLAVYVITLLFGVFQLSRRDFLLLALFGIAGYLAILGLDLMLFPEQVQLTAETLRIGVLVSTMLWTAIFGSYVSQLKTKLRLRNEALEIALAEVHHTARHDHLTQAYNRRYVMQTMKSEKTRSDRNRRPFSVVILDLDHFKIINDRYGHLAGDRVLLGFSERTKGTMRSMDFVGSDATRTFGRYGGEEFIVLLPETDLGGAYRCAERIRFVTEDEPFDDVFKISVSCGVAEYKLGESIEDTLRRADAALYRAKDAGRNCVVADDTSTSGIYSLRIDDDPTDKVIVGQFRQMTHNRAI